jgi:WhiB family redox-sensing transcriptional regulator
LIKEKIDFSWREGAACIGTPIDWFYIGSGHVVRPEVKRLCAGCPVQEQCLDYALKHEDHGYWAGTTEKERARMRKSLKIVLEKPEVGMFIEAKTQKRKYTKASELVPCGTAAAYRRHIKRKEAVDDECRKAAAEYQRERRKNRQ